MLSKSPSRPKSETVIGGGLCPDTWATAFNDSYVGTFRSCAFGHGRSVVDRFRVSSLLLIVSPDHNHIGKVHISLTHLRTVKQLKYMP